MALSLVSASAAFQAPLVARPAVQRAAAVNMVRHTAARQACGRAWRARLFFTAWQPPSAGITALCCPLTYAGRIAHAATLGSVRSAHRRPSRTCRASTPSTVPSSTRSASHRSSM
eukprot:2626964-Prymnesium_polylepis.1